MRLVKNLKRALRCVPFVCLAGCLGQIDEQGNYIENDVDSANEALISSSRAPVRANITGAMPALIPNVANAPGGLYTGAAQLMQAPVASSASWRTSAAGDQHKSSAAFSARLGEAVAAASAARNARSKQWDTIIDGLEAVASYADVDVDISPDAERFFGYTPEHARWMTQDRTPNYVSLPSDPAAFGEIRQRGARLYCAAKEAHAEYGGGSRLMGRKSLASFSILGKRIDLLTLEPTVALAPPKKFASTANDGAQAFMIPLTVGTRFAPISLLPTLPELRTPVSFVTADTETQTAATEGTRTRWWQTAGHADAFISSSRTSKINPQPITLFTVGPVDIMLDMDFGVHTQSCSTASGVRALDTCTTTPHQQATRLLNLGGATTRTGGMAGMAGESLYNDNFWSLPDSKGFIGGNTLEAVDLKSLASPASVRARQNNDKSLQVRTGVTAQMALKAGKVVPLGPFAVEATVGGSVNAAADMVHTVREQMGATERHVPGNAEADVGYDIWSAETSLSVTPHTEGVLWASANASIFLTANLPVIGRQRFGGEVFKADLPLTSAVPTPWEERNRLRISTSTNYTDPSQLESHWPTRGSADPVPFQALPTSIAACMAEPVETGDISAPCNSVPGTYPNATSITAPKFNLCVYAPTNGPDWGYGNTTCKLALANFVKGGTSVASGLMRSRVLDTASANAFKAALDTCANSGQSASAIDAHFDLRMCTSNGTNADKPVTVVPMISGDATLESNSCRP